MRRRVIFLVSTTVVVVAAWLQMGDSMPSWLSLARPLLAAFTSLSATASLIS